MQNNIIGLKIAYYRKLHGYTQEALAKKIGISCQAISKWEQQICCPDITRLPELAEIFGITIDELFGKTGKTEKVYGFVSGAVRNDSIKIVDQP